MLCVISISIMVRVALWNRESKVSHSFRRVLCPKKVVGLLFLVFVSLQTLFAKTDTTQQVCGFKFLGNVYAATADFGRNQFKQDLQAVFPDLKIPAVAYGVEARLGAASSKRWGCGVEISSTMNIDKLSSRSAYEYYNYTVGFYGEYVMVKRKKFELTGHLSLGINQGFLKYENLTGITGTSMTLPDYTQARSVNVRQKITGYAALGLSADWLISSDFSLGLFCKWAQQIGNGYWYVSMTDIKITDLAKTSFAPLRVGLQFSFGY